MEGESDAQVLVAIPTMGSLHPLLVNVLLQWARKYQNVHFYFEYMVAPVDRARNKIVRFFLDTKLPDGKQFTHLFFIDSDTVPPSDALDRLLSHDRAIVSGLTPIVSYLDGELQTYDNCFVEPEREPATGKIVKSNVALRNTGLQRIFRCGASCLLIRRAVFDLVTPPAFNFITNEENTAHVRSEDIDFCDRAREEGIELYADTDVVCGHYKSIML